MKKKRKEKGNYCFPSIMAKMMKSISQRTQYEATMMAIIFILLGIITMAIVTVFFTGLSLFIKIMAVVNTAAAFVFLSSHLVTQFQQYQNYLAMMGIIDDYATDIPQETKEINLPTTTKDEEIDTQTNKFLGGNK